MKRWHHNIEHYSRFLADENKALLTMQRPSADGNMMAGSCKAVDKKLLNNRQFMADAWRQVRAEMQQFLAKNDPPATKSQSCIP